MTSRHGALPRDAMFLVVAAEPQFALRSKAEPWNENERIGLTVPLAASWMHEMMGHLHASGSDIDARTGGFYFPTRLICANIAPR